MNSFSVPVVIILKIVPKLVIMTNTIKDIFLSMIGFIVWDRVLCERWGSSCAWCELWKTHKCMCGVMCRINP